MPVHKVTCPHCDQVVKSAKPLPVGKKVKCPSCGGAIPIRDEAEDVVEVVEVEEDEAPPRKKKPAPANPAAKAKPAAREKAKPAPAPKKEEPAAQVYSWAAEKEEDTSEKPVVDLFPKAAPKKKKIIAEEKIITPSGMLLIFGIVCVIITLGGVIYTLFPVFFSKHLVMPRDILTKSNGDPLDAQWEELKGDQLNQLIDAENKAKVWTAVWAGIWFVGTIYAMLICHGAVKMRFIESWGWAMAASIMALIVFPIGTLLGGVCLKELSHPDVKAGFEDAKKLEPV